VKVKGPRGALDVHVHPSAKAVLSDGQIAVSVDRPDEQATRAAWGLTRALLANAVEGVTAGFEKKLVVVGVGFRADVKGRNLELQVGFSHGVPVEAPQGIEFSLEDAPGGIDGAQTTLVVRGADKELVGRVAADIRKIRPPEPYKGKGIRYSDEHVRRKAGKTAVA
jgi:large subunit ribosomal protein L6